MLGDKHGQTIFSSIIWPLYFSNVRRERVKNHSFGLKVFVGGMEKHRSESVDKEKENPAPAILNFNVFDASKVSPSLLGVWGRFLFVPPSRLCKSSSTNYLEFL